MSRKYAIPRMVLHRKVERADGVSLEWWHTEKNLKGFLQTPAEHICVPAVVLTRPQSRMARVDDPDEAAERLADIALDISWMDDPLIISEGRREHSGRPLRDRVVEE